jgi:hypothetical protein
MVRAQVVEYLQCRRVCPDCLTFQPVKDRRHRRLQTLFGIVDVEAPRLRICRCRLRPEVGGVTFSPVSELLPGRCTPELERVQADLGARTSFREGARILEMLLPTSPTGYVSVRNRLHSIALQLEAADAKRASALEKPAKREIAVPWTVPMSVLCLGMKSGISRRPPARSRSADAQAGGSRSLAARQSNPRGWSDCPNRSRLEGKSACNGYQRW